MECLKVKNVQLIAKQSIIFYALTQIFLVSWLRTNFTDDHHQYTYPHVWGVLSYLYYTHRLGHYSGSKFRISIFLEVFEYFGCVKFFGVDNFERTNTAFLWVI